MALVLAAMRSARDDAEREAPALRRRREHGGDRAVPAGPRRHQHVAGAPGAADGGHQRRLVERRQRLPPALVVGPPGDARDLGVAQPAHQRQAGGGRHHRPEGADARAQAGRRGVDDVQVLDVDVALRAQHHRLARASRQHVHELEVGALGGQLPRNPLAERVDARGGEVAARRAVVAEVADEDQALEQGGSARLRVRQHGRQLGQPHGPSTALEGFEDLEGAAGTLDDLAVDPCPGGLGWGCVVHGVYSARSIRGVRLPREHMDRRRHARPDRAADASLHRHVKLLSTLMSPALL